jgi:hypothetical protein
MTKEARMPNDEPCGAALLTGFAVLLSSLCSCISSFSCAAELSRAIDIRTLPYERSLEKLPVDLTATVGFVESGGTVFVQDDSAGTHMHFKPARNDLRVGDRVRVKGTTLAGLYFPGVDVAELQLLGHEAPPAAVACDLRRPRHGPFSLSTSAGRRTGPHLEPAG